MAARKAAPGTPPTMDRADAETKITKQLDELRKSGRTKRWTQTTRAILVAAFGEPSSAVKTWDGVFFSEMPIVGESTPAEEAEEEQRIIASLVECLESCLDQLDLGLGGAAPDPSALRPQPSMDITALKNNVSFLTNPNYVRIVWRDIKELEVALAGQAWKSVMMLCGSLLEAVLLDVLERNAGKAGTYLKAGKTFPKDASLGDLIKCATDPVPTGGKGPLLSSTTKSLATNIVDHRDLIHPHREIREETQVTDTTARSMVHLLLLVAQDLTKADADGRIAAYVSAP